MKHLLNLTHGVILQRHWQNPGPSLNPRIKRTHKRSLEALFLCLRFYGGPCGALSGGRFSFVGRFNFAQSAALLLEPNGGISQLIKRGLHHV